MSALDEIIHQPTRLKIMATLNPLRGVGYVSTMSLGGAYEAQAGGGGGDAGSGRGPGGEWR